MSKIYLIRHGQASFGAQNYDQLSPIGYQQATLLGQYLAQKQFNIQDVVIGGMKRHLQTAENSVEPINYSKDFILDTNWNEYDHTKILSNYNPEYAQIDAIVKDIGHLPNPMEAFQNIFENAIRRWVSNEFSDDYAESWNQMVERTYNGFERIHTNISSDHSVLVFTSAGTISALLSKIQNLSLEETLKIQWEMPNCGITTLAYQNGKYHVDTIAQIEHFSEHPNMITYR